MKVYQDLEVTMPENLITECLERIISNLPRGWWRDTEGEERLHQNIERIFFFFNCDKREEREEARLAFFQKDNNTFYISNIIPLGRNVKQLTEDQYNIILVDFYRSCLKPLEKELNLDITITKENQTLEDWISQESASKLRFFSDAANKSTGSAHSSDQARWFDFLVSIVLQGDSLDSHRLFKWLIEDEAWSPEIADDLAIEYEKGISLLEYYRSL